MTLPALGASAPLSFSFSSAANVRIVLVDNEPWFVASDIADALGYANPQKAVRDHCKRAKSLKELDGTNRSSNKIKTLTKKPSSSQSPMSTA